MDEEAINERDPMYRLSATDGDTNLLAPWTAADRRTWRRMLDQRPALLSVGDGKEADPCSKRS